MAASRESVNNVIHEGGSAGIEISGQNVTGYQKWTQAPVEEEAPNRRRRQPRKLVQLLKIFSIPFRATSRMKQSNVRRRPTNLLSRSSNSSNSKSRLVSSLRTALSPR